MPKIYSVDQAVRNNRPMVELRGELYYLTDLTLEERLSRMVELYEMQERAEEEAEAADDGDVDFEQIRHVFARAVKELLEDVPDEVAETITESEYQALTTAVRAARDVTYGAEARDATEDEVGKAEARRNG